ncbi:peptidoglycan-binding domain-containing protein [Aquimarina aquimarini]|uniref:peptidoglycan-binding domain-containing protein n=1 Tax=Aquimarina aquimarini TaxID=1191734 RepID=UPI000D5625B3|nr:hypothetical protein [Aquimarina aquimarini]
MKGKTTRKRPLKKKVATKPLSQKAVLMYGIGGGLVLGLGYLVYSHLKNRAAVNRTAQQPITTTSPDTIIANPTLPRVASNQFPLRKGTSGALVRMLQNTLLKKGGQSAMIIRETSFKNGKVDGVFGRGTQRALQAIGFPSALTESNFTTLVGKTTNLTFPAAGIAKEIINAANSQNLFGVLSGLKKITSVSQYQQVSTFFQNVRILGTRVSSLVNALLSVAFKNKQLEKVKIRAAFRKMGLKQNAKGIWFIPGMGNLDSFDKNTDQITQEWNLAIAETPTLLQTEDGSFIVPQLVPGTVVGYITGMRRGMTRILTQSGETVYAPSENLSSF